MNILLVTQIYPEPDDGKGYEATRTVEYFAKEWVEIGHRVVVVHCPSRFPFIYYMMPEFLKNEIRKRTYILVPTWSSTKTFHRQEYGIDIYRQPMRKWIPSQAYTKHTMSRQCRAIGKILEEINFVPDLVAGHFSNPSTELVSRLSKIYYAMSSIVFHNDCSAKNIKKYRIRENIEGIRAVGARSVLEAVSIKEQLGLQKTPFICYSGVPNDAVEVNDKICSKQDYKDGIRFLYAGGLVQKKHVDAVIKAYSRLREKHREIELSLKIIGGGSEEEELRELVLKLNLTDSVCFTGRQPRKEVLNEMKNVQIFTMISQGETFGMVYLEAMLQGCIVIASKGGGFDGIIEDGINGFLCATGDAQMLENIYEQIIGLDAKQRNLIGQRAIDTAMQYSERAVAQRYLNDVIERN
ncbi:glycosyltransferase [Candidatus Merdisoma sp. JLR.KK006]|uniref:glycosyltransferase family 4 protein n=1 Tax=Candidatus Merdisoma sp. JLR.KK006 TaxID=3112626 RepID=UPI002FF370CD